MTQPNTSSRIRTRLLLAGAAAVLAAVLAAAGPAAAQEPTFRIRSDLDAPLNADTGWAGEPGEEVTVTADQPFRLRMEVEPPGPGDTYALQVRRNGGEWETMEAHGFPYPQRELELEFDEQAPGSTPPGWRIASGDAGALAILEDSSGRVLRAAGGESGVRALYTAPWPLPEFSFAARFRLGEEGSDGFAMLFGYVDPANHGLVRFSPDGRIAVVRIAEGREIPVAEKSAVITSGKWHMAEVQLEDGRLEINFDDDTLAFTVPWEAAPAGDLGIAVPASGQVELASLIIEGVPRTPGVSIVATPVYATGEATSDLLAGSPMPFAPGFGVSLAERTPRWVGAERHGEFEWPLVIRRHADGPQINEIGDRFAFRMVDSAGRAVPGAVAQASLAVPAGHLGGTFVETPGRIGPWQASNGDLYFVIEPTETDNRFMMMKSADGGRSWFEVDGANRPETGDLESVDGRLVGDTIHLAHQVTKSVRHHAFNTSNHPTQPDSWAIRDEVAAEAEAVAQTATLVVRPDGSMVAIFLGDRLRYTIRAPHGRWSPAIEIDPGVPGRNAGPQAILGRDGVVHLAYFTDDGLIWYRRILADGTLTVRRQVADGAGTGRAEYGAVLPLAYDPHGDTLFIAYRLADGTLWERRAHGQTALTDPAMITDRPVITDAVDSQQPAADLVLDGGTPHVLFVDEATRSIFSTRKEGAIWQPPVLRIDGIKGSWVRGNLIRRSDGRRVYGFVYDAGSQGGAGLNRYAEFSVEEK